MNQTTWLIIIAISALVGIAIGLFVPGSGPILATVGMGSLAVIFILRLFNGRSK